MAFDSRYDEESAKPPISLHPAFPAIVALWFAALLGLGSLVLPAVLLERAVVGSGIASLVPAAGPPLGVTARSLIALVMAFAGMGLGVVIARRVAKAHRPEPESRIAKLAGGTRRPLSIKDEIGGEGFGKAESMPITRRRALAISEDDRPSDFLYRAPLPGAEHDAPAPFAAAPVVQMAFAEEPLELSDLAEESVNPFAGNPEDETDEDFEMTDRQEFQPAWPTEQHYPAPREFQAVDEMDSRKNMAGPRGLEPLPFSPPSLARRAPEPQPEPEPAVRFEARVEPVAPAAEEPASRADWKSAPLEGLGLVQLVQRLGSTIERRREWMAQDMAQPAAARFSAPPVDFEAAPAEEAAQAMAAFFGSPAAEDAEAAPFEPQAFEPEPTPMPRPGFLQSFAADDDEDDGEDAMPDFSLPLRRPAAVAAAPSFSLADNDAESGEHDDEAEADGEDSYSSLLGMKNPFSAPKNEFIRVEEPEEPSDLVEPAVVFPGQEESAPAASRLFDPPGKGATPSGAAAQPPADADAALRAALATLQRMSGAA